MNPVWGNATTGKGATHGAADMMGLQRLAQWCLMPDK
jgi:hypothetical protein